MCLKEKEKQERDDLDIPKDQDNNGFELVMDKRNKKIVTESIPIKSNTEDTKIEDIDSDKEINIPVKKVVQIEQLFIFISSYLIRHIFGIIIVFFTI